MSAPSAHPAYDAFDPIFVAHEGGKLTMQATKPPAG